MSSPGFSEWAWGLSAKATISADLGRYDEALDLSKQASEAFPIWRYLTYGPILIKSGRIEEGSQIVAELEQQPITPFGSLCLGFMHALLGDADNSLKWLSLPEKHGWYPWIRVWPGMGLENLYDDPRFLKLFEEMNLPAYPQKLRNDQLETGQLVE